MKLNESEEPMKRREYENAVKTSDCEHCWDESGGNLITGRMAVGVQATGAWYRLLWGTGEFRTLMIIEKSKLGGPDEDKSRDANSDAEELVVVLKLL
jgi:hypothetical protein